MMNGNDQEVRNTMDQSQEINLLLADTSENNSEAVLKLLEKQNFSIKSQRISKKAELSEALSKQHWDILLLNNELDDFSTRECMDWLKRLQSQTALLELTQKEIDLQTLTNNYQAGAAGLISLKDPDYLLQVFRRELNSVKARCERARLLNDNQELLERCRLLLSSSREAVCYIHQGMHIYANESYIQKFGFESMDEVSSTPFIDLVAEQSREDLKECFKQIENQWEDGQQKQQLTFDVVARRNDGKDFKAQLLLEPTLFDGEKCLQVFVSTEKENQKKLHQAVRLDLESGLFNRQFFLQQFEHLLGSIKQDKVTGGVLLYVRVNMNDQLRSRLGYETADAELRTFTALLKKRMNKNNVIARFGDNDFIIMLAGDRQNAQLKQDISDWQQSLKKYRFKRIAGEDIPEQAACNLITIDIDKNTVSIKDILTRVYQNLNEHEQQQKPEKIKRDRITASKSKSLSEMGSIKIELEDKTETPPRKAVTDEGVADSKLDNIAGLTASVEDNPAPGVKLELDELSKFISGRKIKLHYEAVIAVADIETEFNEVEVAIDDQRFTHLNSDDIYAMLDRNPLAAKFDRLILELTLEVMSDLYKQGQTQNFAVRLNAFSLTDEKLLAWLGQQLKTNKLAPESLIVCIQQQSALSNVGSCISFLNVLKEAGMRFYISNFTYSDAINNVVRKRRPNYIKLANGLSEQISTDEELKSEIEELTENLHDENIKVIAGQVDDSSTLSAYWVCNVDLVQGKYFQKQAMALNAATFQQEEFSALGKTA
ncbi:MAG: hypothetical protein CMQ38_08775 [Gammaproteobacteria bacterium]|nr:hypothetical protein [Gammaproteobacteria bacterium]|tara:strand:- start:193 stop:2505 length:2313 start_codon:yes stop_codon:yes gene_type:complete